MPELLRVNEPALRIVGQGIAGSMLGWACERAGIAFVIIDRGHAGAASRIGAGLVSPLTGRRLVPTWQFGAWRDLAWREYRAIEAATGVRLVRALRLRRLFRDEAERQRFVARLAAPDVAAWVESADDAGLWLRGAFQVETGRLIAALRERWRARGWLREEDEAVAPDGAGPIIWCAGAAAADDPALGAAWERSKGELATGRMTGLDPETALNDGQWLLPPAAEEADGVVRVGASFGREDLNPGPTAAGQAMLQAAARRLTGQSLGAAQGLAGLRVTVRDRRPVAGWLDAAHRHGMLNGLAAKGALWAPGLADQWVSDRLGGTRIEPAARADRFRRQTG